MTDDALPEPDRVPGCPHPRETARLLGQARAEAAFLEALAGGRMHHAWLLRGPAGTGKATLAYRMARALIAAPPAGTGAGLFAGPPAPLASLDAPPGCPVAARIRAGSEPALRTVRRGVNEKTGRARTQILVEDIRDLRRFLALSMPDGGARAVIVDTADEMNPQAANALLKLLEEPPPRTTLILAAHSPGRLLPTIRSRCRTLDLAPLGAADLAAALAQATGAPLPASDAAALAELAAGSVGEAARLLEADGLALWREVCGVLGTGGRADRAALHALAEKAAAKGAEGRFALVLRLAGVLLARLARRAAGRPPPVELPGEAALAPAARTPAQGRLWAETAARIARRGEHARAVNLDPAQTVIDTFLDLDETLARARRAA